MKKLRKYINSYFAILLLLLVCAGLFSCSDDNPVKSSQSGGIIIDTIDAYTWTMDTIYGYYVDKMFVADTSNIFLAGAHYMIKTDGKLNTVIDYGVSNFVCTSIAGFDKNEVYLGGGNPLIDSSGAVLMIYNGSGFKYYAIPEDTSFQIANILVKDRTEAWLVTGRNNVYRFQNGNFIKYRVDSVISYGKLFLSPTGELYLFSDHLACHADCVHNFAYKFENDHFQLISLDSTDANTQMWNGVFLCGNDIIRLGLNNLFYHTGLEWLLVTGTGYFQPYNIGGRSKNDLVCYGMRPGYPSMFLWNGTKLSMEKNFDLTHNFPQLPTSNQGVIIHDNKIYMNFSYFRYQISSLVIGRPKGKMERR